VSAPINPALHPPGAAGLSQPARVHRSPPARGQTADTEHSSGPSFADALKDASRTSGAEPLHFSKHALERVQRRGIALDPTTLGRLHEGVGRAAGKGSRDSIVLVDGTAFVVSVNNRTVVTAVGSEHMREHVFTNIDSAVIA
jgi:flagellar operon protein